MGLNSDKQFVPNMGNDTQKDGSKGDRLGYVCVRRCGLDCQQGLQVLVRIQGLRIKDQGSDPHIDFVLQAKHSVIVS
jgi:hypothetical protein